jgi:hypothetical protein
VTFNTAAWPPIPAGTTFSLSADTDDASAVGNATWLAAPLGSGATSAFAFGRGLGVIEGALASFERPTTMVRPQVWTKALGVGSDKGAHRLAAQRLWPADAQVFNRVKDDGRADAALLAHWYLRK